MSQEQNEKPLIDEQNLAEIMAEIALDEHEIDPNNSIAIEDLRKIAILSAKHALEFSRHHRPYALMSRAVHVLPTKLVEQFIDGMFAKRIADEDQPEQPQLRNMNEERWHETWQE